jgi:hypothetical protein
MFNDSITLSELSSKIKETIKEDISDLEAETIALELSSTSSLLLDKINVLKLIKEDNSKFYTNPLFFVYATEVINNTVADFMFFPGLTSLEIIYAIIEVNRLLGRSFSFSVEVMAIIKNVFISDGFSHTPNVLHGQLEPLFSPDLESVDNPDYKIQELAVTKYIQHMRQSNA